jgi:hypothetical protein
MPAMFPGSPVGAVALGIAIAVGTLYAFHSLPRLQGWHRIAVLGVALVAPRRAQCSGHLRLPHKSPCRACSSSVGPQRDPGSRELNQRDRSSARADHLTTSTTEVIRHGKRTTVSAPNKVDSKVTEKLESERTDHLATLTSLRKRQEMNEAEIGPARYLTNLIGRTARSLRKLPNGTGCRRPDPGDLAGLDRAQPRNRSAGYET